MNVEGGKKYNVRLIPQTCNREDAIREIVGALDHLNAISDEIFSSIRTRLNSQRQQVESISNRINIATGQVAALKGSQKAIRIISPAKYPCDAEGASSLPSGFGPGTFPTLVSKDVPTPPVLGHNIEESDEEKCQRRLRFDAQIKHPNDLLSIFHVKEPKLGDLAELDNVADVGLGRPPTSIRNMDSFFLFNTVDNPYVNYKMTDRTLQDRNFGTLKPTRKGEEVQAETCPAVLPDDAGAQKTDIDDFYYYPSALEIPNIDVPESLPNLPGIADSFDLEDDFMSPMFPTKPLNLSNPPAKNANVTVPTSQPPPSLSFMPEKHENFFTSTPQEPSTSFHSGPSPVVVAEKSQVTQVPIPTVPMPPPPPPPPPPMIMDSPRAEPTSAAVGGDLRSSLMAAIRDAGGSGNARLKSAKDRKYESKKKKQDEKEKTMSNELQDGGDLMSDLKNTLAMRRRGISGIQDGQKRAGLGDIMVSLAATIPTIDSSVDSNTAIPGGSDDDDWD